MASKAQTRKAKPNAPDRAPDALSAIHDALASAEPDPEALARHVRSLKEIAASADDAFLPEIAQCARLIAGLIELTEYVPSQTPGDGEPARRLGALAIGGLEALERMLDEEPDAQGRFEEFVRTANDDWGEYLALSAGAGDSPGHYDPGPVSDLDDAEPPPADLPAVDIGEVLRALGPPPSPDSNEPSVGERATPAASKTPKPATACPFVVPVPPSEPARIQVEPGILEAFLEDACRCLASMEQAVLGFEAEPTSHEPLVEVCRELHTLKGAGSSIGLSELAAYLHKVEDYVGACQSVEPESVDVEPMLQAVDAVRAQIDALGGGAHEARSAPSAESSRPAISGVSSPRIGAAPLAERRQTLRLLVGEASLRVEGSRIDRLMDLLAELVTMRNSRDNGLARLKDVAAELTRCAARIRATGDARVPSGGWHAHASVGMARYGDGLDARVSGAGPGDLWYDAFLSDTGGSLLSEIASDVSELARSLRELEEPLSEGNRALSRLIGQFRHELIDLRRVPVRGLFRRLERPARDAAHNENKQVKLVFVGENARIERSLEESAYEPLLHVVRNAVSHGIETPGERQRAGKPPVGTVVLEARSSASLLVLEVRDDGRGMDYEKLERRGREKGLLPPAGRVTKEELLRLIFHPGFSTRATISEISGRGVGMDVASRAIERMGGHVEIDSVPGRGTTLRLSIPLRTGIEHAMLVRVAGQIFAFPLHNVDAANERPASNEGRSEPESSGGNGAVRVAELLGLRHTPGSGDEGSIILNQGELAPAEGDEATGDKPDSSVPHRPRKFPVSVDSVVGPEEVVVRCLPPLLRSSKLFSGVTLSGAGEIVLLFNVPRLIALGQEHVEGGERSASTGDGWHAHASVGMARLRILVVDDSLSTRRGLAQTLEGWGFAVDGCADGLEALDLLRSHAYDVVLTDLEMPKLGGLELLAETKRRQPTRDVPVIVMTGRGDERARASATELGAAGYLPKPIHPEVLSQALEELGLLAPAALQPSPLDEEVVELARV